MLEILNYPFDSKMIMLKRKNIKKSLLTNHEYIEKKIAILGGSTTHDIKEILELFLLNNGIKPIFYESEYGQYYQDSVFPNQKLDSFAPDVVYIHTSVRNITSFPKSSNSTEQINKLLNEQFNFYVLMWQKIESKYHCPIIQNNFEYPFYRILGNQDSSNVHGKVNFVTRLNLKFYEYAQTHPNFYINDINYQSADYGLAHWSNPVAWYLYKYSLDLEAIPLLSFNISNIIKSLFGKNKKAFALDLDNTLWGGIIGDDGVENIEIGKETARGEAYTEFQQYLKELQENGIILNIISKNEHSVALAGLEHPDMTLKKDDFIDIKANWDTKSNNLMQMAKELSLLPESFVFIDDNPAERDIIKQEIPDVAVPQIDIIEHYIFLIDRSGYFESTTITKDDFMRNKMYQENFRRFSFETTFSNYEDYLESLGMEATIGSFDKLYLARIAQLTNKTNQFNLTTKRFTQDELEVISDSKNYLTIYGSLKDRFGDNGIVSLVIGKVINNEVHLILWLMSCRVLKRGMEFAMFDTIVEKCQTKKIHKIFGYYYPTNKNGMVKDFYKDLGFTLCEEKQDGSTTWYYNLDINYSKKNKHINVSLPTVVH